MAPETHTASQHTLDRTIPKDCAPVNTRVELRETYGRWLYTMDCTHNTTTPRILFWARWRRHA